MKRDLSLLLIIVLTMSMGLLISCFPSKKTNEAGQFELPFDLHNNLIILKVSINGSSPLSFILDSGVSDVIITELGYGDSLELNYARQIKVKGLGKGEPVDAYYSVLNEISFAGLKSSNQNIRVLMQDVFSLSKRMGRPIHGIIGYSVFQKYIVEIQYSRKKIIFHDPEKYQPHHKRRGFTLPLEVENTKPYIMAAANIQGDSLIPVKLFLDTGASHTLWLAEDCKNSICVPEDAVEKYLGAGLNGDITGHMSVVDKLKIDKIEFKGMITSFPDQESVQHLFTVNNRNGSIGAEILRRFNITFNYQDREITFVPNHNLRNELSVNRSGFEIEMPAPGFPLYTVAFIEEGSPSWEAGLRQDDQILKVNGKNTLFMNFEEIIGTLYQKANTKIKLEIQRGEEYKEIHFKLQEPFTFPPLRVSSKRETGSN
jgi:hypothetical protein